MMQLRPVIYAALAASIFAFSAPSYAIDEGTLIQPGAARVTVGRVFGPGDRLFSVNQEFRFERQIDGNLVVRRNSDDKVFWASDTANKNVSAVAFEKGPKLKVFSGNTLLWIKGYFGDKETGYGDYSVQDQLSGVGFLDLQNDGNLIIKVLVNVWNNNAASVDYGGSNAFFPTGTYLYKGSSYTAGNGHYALTFQNDGNLVVTHNGTTPLWSTKTAGKGGSYAVVQDDGNFVLYNDAKKEIWSSKTYNSKVYYNGYKGKSNYLVLRTDGRLDLIGEVPFWDSASDKGNKL